MHYLNKEMLFASKAKTLLWLRRYAEFNIPEVEMVTAEDWKANSEAVIDHLHSRFGSALLAVRSSCFKEDSMEQSCAGAFVSVLNVPAHDQSRLGSAISEVFASYDLPDHLPASQAGSEHLLIQPMVDDIVLSGVIMTRVLNDGAPYYVINYDDESGRTDTITGGTGVSKTVYIYRNATREDFDSDRLFSIFEFACEVEETCAHTRLDIEFGIDSRDVIHLFQVRPICTSGDWEPGVNELVTRKLSHITSFVSERMKIKPGLYGHKTVLGVMPDWNPAEMIGVTPHPLASSLYRELITRRVWSRAREMMGYRPMPPEELMVLIAGRPYIDVRASFNSFLPAGLQDSVSGKLVEAWIERLECHPELHDKIEFDIAQTVMDFSFDSSLESKYPGVLDSAEILAFREALAHLTTQCLDTSEGGSLAQAEAAVRKLHQAQCSRTLPDSEYVANIKYYCEECRTLGTLPFSVLARHGFIAESLLRTAVSRGAISEARVSLFKRSIETISGEMGRAFSDVVQGSMSREHFLDIYGHLRPGSYDILSPRYRDRSELFSNDLSLPDSRRAEPFSFKDEERRGLESLARENGLEGFSIAVFREYVERAVAGREYAKFVFTRNVSDILELIAIWGERYGFSREDLAYLNIMDLIGWCSVSLLRDQKAYYSEQIAAGKELFSLGSNVQLGYLIRSPRDVYVVPQHRSAPNFIGAGNVEADVVRLDAHSSCSSDITGKIVCIENADPGFDWIFTRNIAGLVTKFGGTNSHMAIRCAEYGLPAAIGVGEKLFLEFSKVGRGVINAGGGVLRGV